MAYYQPLDQVVVKNRSATVMFVWPDRTLVRVQHHDTGQRESVAIDSVESLDTAADRRIAEAYQHRDDKYDPYDVDTGDD